MSVVALVNRPNHAFELERAMPYGSRLKDSPRPSRNSSGAGRGPSLRGTMLPATFLTMLLFAGPPTGAAQEARRVSLEMEFGPVWQTRNDVQIPNDPSATRFSLRDLTGSGPWPAGRLYLTWHINQRHEIRALFAPLTIVETGTLAAPASFADASYVGDAATEGTYAFNSYRVTYRYRLQESADWTWWIGFTAKIRDANIELRQGSTSSRKKDLGFVPLLHVAADRRLSPKWRLRLDADALAGGPGRAEDVSLKAAYDLGPWTLSGGYRTVEGGADVDAVYTFAWLHYAVLSAAIRF